jgi:hypothetical protein
MFLNVRWGQDLRDVAHPCARLLATPGCCTPVVSPGHEALNTGGRGAPWSGARALGKLAVIVALVVLGAAALPQPPGAVVHARRAPRPACPARARSVTAAAPGGSLRQGRSACGDASHGAVADRPGSAPRRATAGTWRPALTRRRRVLPALALAERSRATHPLPRPLRRAHVQLRRAGPARPRSGARPRARAAESRSRHRSGDDDAPGGGHTAPALVTRSPA